MADIKNKMYSATGCPPIIFHDTPCIQRGWEVTEHGTAPTGQTRQK